MIRSDFTKGVLLALVSALSPTLALAAPTTMLEKSATYAFGDEVHAFRVPTTDSTGKIKYNDVVIKLTVGPTGVIATTAKVTATASPNPPTSVNLVPGTYKASDGTTCTVTNIVLTNGRIQSNVLCLTPTTTNWEFSVVTGSVSAGHPYLDNLVAAAIDKRSDVNTQIWGLVTSGTGYAKIAGCGLNVFITNRIVGARTNGNQLIVSAYYPSNPASFTCSGTLVKQ